MPFLCVVWANEPQATYNVQHKARAKKEDAGKIINDHFFPAPSSRAPRRLWLLLAAPSWAFLHRDILITI